MSLLSALWGLAADLTSADSSTQTTETGAPSLLVDTAKKGAGALWTRGRVLVRAAGAVATAFSELSLDPTNGGLNVSVAGGAAAGSTANQGTKTSDDTNAWKVRLYNASAALIGRATAAASLPVALSNEDVTTLGTLATAANQTTGNTSLGTLITSVAAILTAVGLTPAAEDESGGTWATTPKLVAAAQYGLDLLGTASADAAACLRTGPGVVSGGHLVNANASARYFVIVDKNSEPAAGDTAKWWVLVPATTTDMAFGPNDLGGVIYCADGVAYAYCTAIDLTTTPGSALVGTVGTNANHDCALYGKGA